MNPLLCQFQSDGGAHLEQEGYALYAKLQKYMISFTGRCGSTLLADLLARTGTCGNPEELFSEEFVGYGLQACPTKSLGEYLGRVCTSHQTFDRFGFEIDPMRLSWLIQHPKMPEQEVFSSSMRHVWMVREDIVAQGFSYATARAQGIWHDFVANGDAAVREMPRLTDVDVWAEVLSVIHAEWWMQTMYQRYGIRPLRISYEQLVAERVNTVGRVLLAIGVPLSEVKPDAFLQDESVRKLKYLGGSHRYLEFMDRNGRTLRELEHMRRENAHVDHVIAMLEGHGITFDLALVRKFALPPR